MIVQNNVYVSFPITNIEKSKFVMNKCIEILRKKGIHKYRVFVLDCNEDALKFWRRLGFEEQVYNYRTFQMNTAAGKPDDTS